MAHSGAPRAALAASFGVTLAVLTMCGGVAARAADVASSSREDVTLTINPDGSASWNGEPLANEPALKDKIARRTQQSPRLELDLHFHSVSQLSDSNRQTLLDLVELTARFGFVHVETSGSDAKLTVLGPSAAGVQAPK